MKKTIRVIAIAGVFAVVAALGTAAFASKGHSTLTSSPARATSPAKGHPARLAAPLSGIDLSSSTDDSGDTTEVDDPTDSTDGQSGDSTDDQSGDSTDSGDDSTDSGDDSTDSGDD